MTRCTRPHCGGQVLAEDGRATCLLCGQVYREAEPTILEKMVSNATREDIPGVHGKFLAQFGPREPQDTQALVARVMANIRRSIEPSEAAS